MKLVFSINRGELARVSEIRFEGNENIKSEELVADFKECIEDGWQIFDARRYGYITRQCSLRFMFSKGYFRAKILEPKFQLVSGSYVVTINVYEGVRFRYGELKVQGAKAFTEKEVLELVGLKTGEIANGKILQDLFYEKLKRIYADKGYILYDAEFEPKFIDSQKEGEDATVDLLIMIDEGRQFKLGEIKFIGVDEAKAQELKRFFLLEYGEIFNQSKIEEGIKKINELREFYPIDFDGSDVEVRIKERIEGNIIVEKDGIVLREKVEETEDSNNVKLNINLRKIQQ